MGRSLGTEVVSKDIIHDRFKNCFGLKTEHRWSADMPNYWDEFVGLVDKMIYIFKSFSKEVIKVAAWGLGGGQGAQARWFFKKKFPQYTLLRHCEPEVIELLKHHAHVIVILKKKEIKGVGDFRPVSVLNASINILSKVLVNHLREIFFENYHL